MAYVTNEFHKRVSSLKDFANSDNFRQDIISANLGEWIMRGTLCLRLIHSYCSYCQFPEYKKATKGLGDVRTDHPVYLLYEAENTFLTLMQTFLGDLPMVRLILGS